MLGEVSHYTILVLILKVEDCSGLNCVLPRLYLEVFNSQYLRL